MFHRPKTESPAEGDTAVIERPAEDGAKDSAPEEKSAETTPENSSNEEKETQEMSSFQTEEKTEQATDQRQVEIPGNVQRPAQTAPAATGRVPGSYSYPGAYGTQGSQDISTGRKLIVGSGISLSGEIEACDHLIVEGKVEAALKGASLLDIAEAGVYYGTVEIDEATIAGRFEGDLTVNGRLTVRSGGSITGVISYRELAVEAGATIDGKISPITKEKSEAKKPAKGGAKQAEASADSRPANEEEGLFQQAAEAAE